MTIADKRRRLEPGRRDLPITRQCELLDVPRSTAYYESRRDPERVTKEKDIMKKIDELYTEHPHLGRIGMSDALFQRYALIVNPKRTRRLMKLLGLAAVYPRPRKNTSKPCKQHQKYPYLLRGMDIDHVDQVWCSDMTYIRLEHGFGYLVAVMDWYSRAVLSWGLSSTMDARFCVDALLSSLDSGRSPEIFNTDQGSQFTSELFTKPLLERGVSISMDGRGRAFDNIMIERLWRTVKYENVYLKDYVSLSDARIGLAGYFDYYNHERCHSSLGRRTPGSLYGLKRRFDTGWRKDRLLSCGAGVGAARCSVSPVALRAPSETLHRVTGAEIPL